MKSKSTLLHFLTLAGSSLLAISSSQAAIRTWGGGDLNWTNTTASGWNAAVPVSADTANINSGTVTLTTNLTFANTPVSINVNGGTLSITTGMIVSNAWSNARTVTIGSAGTLRLNSWGYQVAGSLGALDYGRDRLVINGGVIEVTGNSTNSGRNFTVGTGGATLRSSVNAGQTWTFNRDSNPLYHDIQVNDGRTLTLDGTGNGVIENTIVNTTGSGNITKTGSGTWTLTATNTYTGLTSITGAGTLALGATGSINNSSGVALGTSGTFDVSAKSGYTVARLTGSGTVVGALTVSTELAIGNSPGMVTYTGDLTLGAASNSKFEVTGGGITGDLGDVNGLLTIATGATLDLIQLGTYTANDKFTLFAYNTLSGTFAGLADDSNLTDNLGGIWKINYNDTTAGVNGGVGNLYVTVTAVPEPGAALIGSLGLLALLRRRR